MHADRVTSIAAIDARDWDRLAIGRGLFVSHRWLRWAERDPGFAATYLLVRDRKDRLVGALPTYLWHGNGGALDAWYDPWRVFVAPTVPGPAGRSSWLPVLLLGGRCGYHGDVLVDASLDISCRRAILALLMTGAEQVAADTGARSVALMYVAQPVADLVRQAGGPGAQLVATSAEAVISTDVDNFDGYLRRFPSRRRTTLKSEISMFDRAEVDVREATLGQVHAEIGPLLARHARNFGGTETDAVATRRLAEQSEVLDSISRVFLETRGGRVVGFSLCYEWEGTLYVRSSAVDRDAGSARFAYFNLAIYRPVRHAIEHRLREVNLGASSYQAKVGRGASLRSLWSVVWPPAEPGPATLSALAQPAAEAAEAQAVLAVRTPVRESV